MNKKAVGFLSQQLDGNGGPFQIFPFGPFKAIDGRPEAYGLQFWYVNPEKVLNNLASRVNDMPVYYEHQDVYAEFNGQPAPAAGWIDPKNITWNERGLFASKADWTQRALEYIDGKEYRYISALFSFDIDTGEIDNLFNVSLVNSPGIDGMDEVSTKAGLRYLVPTEGMKTMPVKDILKAAGFPEVSDESEATKLVSGLLSVMKSLGANNQTEAAAAVAALKESVVVASRDKDEAMAALAKSASEIAALKAEVEKLSSSGAADKVKAIIASNPDKFPTESLKEWGRNQSLEVIEGYVKTAPGITALKGMQTGGKAPAGTQNVSALEARVAEMYPQVTK